jgi:hypothetical protein
VAFWWNMRWNVVLLVAYQAVEANSTCKPGTHVYHNLYRSYAPGSTKVYCLPCQKDQYQPKSDQPACLKCPNGKFQPLLERSSCMSDSHPAKRYSRMYCHPGTFQTAGRAAARSTTQMARCTPCPPMHFQPRYNKVRQKQPLRRKQDN